MASHLSVNLEDLKRLSEAFKSPLIRGELERLPLEKAIAALVAQAISDNFDKQGPGWAPLKAETLRRSVGKKVISALRKQALTRMQGVYSLKDVKKQRRIGELHQIVGKMLERHERKFTGTDLSNRAILRKTGLLMKSVTTPQAPHGVWPAQNQAHLLVWGTDLVYAGVHNYGYPARHIPKREFLVIRDQFKEEIARYVFQRILKIIQSKLGSL